MPKAEQYRVTADMIVWDMDEDAAKRAVQQALENTKRIQKPIVTQVVLHKDETTDEVDQ